ncbi:MAG: hypothetical protein WA810_10155 [Maribacter sp.]
MIETVRLITDAGLLVLIWMVQLIAYPSFSYFKVENLYLWHETYMKRIAFIVIPLMFGQLITGGFQLFDHQDFYTVSSILLIALVWLSTFSQFVPLHTNISEKRNVEESIQQLRSKNWLRTILWTLLFMFTVYNTLRA